VWQQYHPEGRKNRGLLSLMRRHHWRLKDDQHANLMTYLPDFPVLQALYVAKQKLIRFMLLKTVTAHHMRAKLPGYLEPPEQLKDSPLRAGPSLPCGDLVKVTASRRAFTTRWK
jgi:hypothetical protein